MSDPVVSPADTIRAAIGNPAYKTNYDALVALNALLAVGERDRRQIARLTEALREIGLWEHDAGDPPYGVIRSMRDFARAVLAGEEDARP